MITFKCKPCSYVSDPPFYVYPNLRTAAAPRPNAYIPDPTNAIPVPKPYGKFAPFKPSEVKHGKLLEKEIIL